MDDRRFDNVVRSFARHRSRRDLAGGLLAGGVALLASHLRFPGAAAGHRHVPQGEWCVDDDQCDPGLVCAWNGFGSAGAACCAPIGIGVACADDFGCCGPASCLGGICTDLASAPTIGDPCDPSGNPCVAASGGFTCGWSGWYGDYRCCAIEGARCAVNEQCCGSNGCVGGVCTS